MRKNLLKFINDEQLEELSAQVFNQKLPDSTGNGTYTEVLSAEEETAFIQKLLSKEGDEAAPWLEFILAYAKHYVVCNQAIDILLDNWDKANSIPLLVSLLSTVYNERQGLAICDIALKCSSHEETLSLLQMISQNGRFFSEDIYRKLGVCDARITDSGYNLPVKFAESYRQNVEDYKNQKNVKPHLF